MPFILHRFWLAEIIPDAIIPYEINEKKLGQSRSLRFGANTKRITTKRQNRLSYRLEWRVSSRARDALGKKNNSIIGVLRERERERGEGMMERRESMMER